MSGFLAWANGPWGTLACALAIPLAFIVGHVFGWWRCERAQERADEEEHYARQEAMARRVHPVYRQRRTGTAAFLNPPAPDYRYEDRDLFMPPPEVAHEEYAPPGLAAAEFDVDAFIAWTRTAADEIIEWAAGQAHRVAELWGPQ